MFPCVYFFFPETRLRSLEEMDDIFKKSSNIFDVVPNSINEPYRFDKHGELKVDYIEEIMQVEGQEVMQVEGSGREKESDPDRRDRSD